MGTLLLKFSILAGVFGIVGLIGLAALLASVIWLIIRVANFDSVVPALICVLASVALTVGGLFLSPAPEGRAAPYLKESWEAPLEAVKGQIGKLKALKDNGPWARFFKDEEAPEEDGAADADNGPEESGDQEPEMERMEVIRTSAPEQEDGSRSPTGRNQPGKDPEAEAAEPAPEEQSRVLVDEVLDG